MISSRLIVVYFCVKTQNLLLFFKKLRPLVLKISDVNKSILVFKFWVIKMVQPSAVYRFIFVQSLAVDRLEFV